MVARAHDNDKSFQNLPYETHLSYMCRRVNTANTLKRERPMRTLSLTIAALGFLALANFCVRPGLARQ